MAIYKKLAPSDKKTAKSFLNQLIDVLQEDISGSTSRRKYQHFVTGGVGPGVTSSLFQTVYDQDFTLQTANPVFDITVGIAPYNATTNPNGIAGKAHTDVDASGKVLYPSSSLMMREKTDIYRQFAQTLLGSGDSLFKVPLEDGTAVDAAMFIAFKRLFARDQLKRETFAMRFYQTASFVSRNISGDPVNPGFAPGSAPAALDADGVQNIYNSSITGSAIFTDIGSSTQKFSAVGGQYGLIKDSANTSRNVGLLFYDVGVAVFDLAKITSGSQFISGTIDAMHPTGRINLGGANTATYAKSKLIPDLMVSGSMDNIIDHLAVSRFQSGSLTAITFQNVTNINSTLYFCRASADEFNYSSNPTYVDANGRINVITPGSEDQEDPFTYVTSVGLYDEGGNLLAVAKLSRPVEKSPERDVTFRVRLDF